MHSVIHSCAYLKVLQAIEIQIYCAITRAMLCDQRLKKYFITMNSPPLKRYD